MTQGNLIGVTDAAAALGINASTVSRYLAKHPEINRAPKGSRPQVDLEELRGLSLPQITSGRMNGVDHQGEVWI